MCLSDTDLETDGDASQTDSFSEKVKAYGADGFLVDKMNINSQEEVRGSSQEEQFLRCSGRLAEKNTGDIPVMERAKTIKAKTLDNDGKCCFPSVLSTDKDTLLDIAKLIGVDLGISLEMVDHNLDLIRAQEEARMAVFSAKENMGESAEPMNNHIQPEEVDTILKELLTLNQEDLDGELEHVNLFNNNLNLLTGLLMDKRSNEVYSVKSPVRTVVRGRKHRRKKR